MEGEKALSLAIFGTQHQAPTHCAVRQRITGDEEIQMGRRPSITLGALNIKTHPHSPAIYVDLFRTALQSRAVGKIRGSDFAVMGWCQENASDQASPVLYGELYKFLNIDPEQPWLNIADGQPIEVSEDHPMPVPVHLKPNLRRICFAFFPQNHRFVFDTKSLTPNSAKKALDGILSQASITEHFGAVDVEVETSREGMEHILRIARKTKITVDLTVPNPDDLGGLEEEVMARLIGSRVRKEHLVQSSTHPEGIDPDPYTRAMISLSRSNGKTTVIGLNEEEVRVEESTESHPLTKRFHYDPEQETQLQAVVSSASELIALILQQRDA
jgi:hypothetical protein